MKRYKLVVSETYQRDLANIVYYLSHNLEATYAASTLLDEVEHCLSGLSIMPYRYGLVKDGYLQRKEFRNLKIKNYIIFFKIHEAKKIIEVHRILHSKQNWIDILR